MLQEILNDIGVVVGILDKHTLIPVFLSEPFKEFVGTTTDDISKFLQSKDEQLTNENLLKEDRHLDSQFVTEIRVGRVRKTIAFKVSHDSLGNILIHGEDITNAKKLEYLLKSYSTILEKQQKLYELAYTDSLTGVPNRRAFFKHYAENLERNADAISSVCILDIDHFKQVNDTYGHDFGDQVLKYFAQQVVEGIDNQCFFARIGGEEFCVFSKNRTSEQLMGLIEQILERMRSKAIITPKKDSLKISFSAGVSEYKKDGDTLDELLNKADKALYFAKAIGRSCVISFSCDLSDEQDETALLRAVPR